jgi:hypothetical protein
MRIFGILASQMYENSKDAASWHFFIEMPEMRHLHLVSYPYSSATLKCFLKRIIFNCSFAHVSILRIELWICFDLWLMLLIINLSSFCQQLLGFYFYVASSMNFNHVHYSLFFQQSCISHWTWMRFFATNHHCSGGLNLITFNCV